MNKNGIRIDKRVIILLKIDPNLPGKMFYSSKTDLNRII